MNISTAIPRRSRLRKILPYVLATIHILTFRKKKKKKKKKMRLLKQQTISDYLSFSRMQAHYCIPVAN